MNELRLASLDDLRARLRAELGTDSLLFRRFDQALAMRDDERVADAMSSLEHYPPELRQRVHDIVLAWLFGDAEGAPAAAVNAPGSTSLN